jgi:hypothetical protein
VKSFIITGGYRVAGGGDVKVVDTQMFGAEVGIKDGGEKKIGEPAFEF